MFHKVVFLEGLHAVLFEEGYLEVFLQHHNVNLKGLDKYHVVFNSEGLNVFANFQLSQGKSSRDALHLVEAEHLVRVVEEAVVVNADYFLCPDNAVERHLHVEKFMAGLKLVRNEPTIFVCKVDFLARVLNRAPAELAD